METIITIQPLPKSARLPSDRSTHAIKKIAGHLTENEVFAEVYPRAAELGHEPTYRNGLNDYSYIHA